MELRQVEGLPPGLLDAEAHQLTQLLGGPTLLRLSSAAGRFFGGREEEPAPDDQGFRQAGRQREGPAPLFVSLLLHGNETSGWDGMRRVLRAGALPQRELLIFIGNVAAAAANVRTLPGQGDFNRIWRPATGIAAELLDCIGDQPLMAVVDLHNNTGINPHYAVLTDLNPRSLGLARLFSEVGVHIEEPDSVLTRAFAKNGPCIALELGPVGDPKAADRAADFLAALFRLTDAPVGKADDLRLFRTLARVHVPEDAAFGFAGPDAGQDQDLLLDGGLQANNFRPVPPGTAFGLARNGAALQVLDNSHRDVTDRYLEVRDGRILAATTLIPAMYTSDAAVVRQDCLCYLMTPAAST